MGWSNRLYKTTGPLNSERSETLTLRSKRPISKAAYPCARALNRTSLLVPLRDILFTPSQDARRKWYFGQKFCASSVFYILSTLCHPFLDLSFHTSASLFSYISFERQQFCLRRLRRQNYPQQIECSF